MPIRMMSPVRARLVQVLKDFLPAELDLIDAEENDGITTPDIPAANYHDFDRQLLNEFPACTMRAVSSTPVGQLGIRPDTFGRRVHALHRIEIKFHATARQAFGRTLEKLMERYVNGAARVLTVMKERLQTTADPVEWGSPGANTVARWREAATYGPEADQGDGTIVRTAMLPIDVERIEAR